MRRTVVKCIGASKATLRPILQRTRDVDDQVRKAAYKFIAEKVILTFGAKESHIRGIEAQNKLWNQFHTDVTCFENILQILFQVSIKILSIGEREELLRQGLTDRNQGVQKVVEKELGKNK